MNQRCVSSYIVGDWRALLSYVYGLQCTAQTAPYFSVYIPRVSIAMLHVCDSVGADRL